MNEYGIKHIQNLETLKVLNINGIKEEKPTLNLVIVFLINGILILRVKYWNEIV